MPPVASSRAPEQAQARPASAAVAYPLFPVATSKFVILSICSFSIYELYWCYENWKRIKSASGDELSPFWRAVFAPLWGFSLFKRIQALAAQQDPLVDWSAGALATAALATAYLVLSGMWRLPGPWWLIGFGSLIPMIPVQRAAQRVNERHATSTAEDRNDNYSTVNVVTIIIGGILLVVAIVGTFVSE